MRVIWREQAEGEFKEAIQYLRKRNPAAALHVAKTIRQRVRQLGTQPGLGRPGRVADTRELVITGTPYLVAYTVDTRSQCVIILSLQHGAQLWPESFADDDQP